VIVLDANILRGSRLKRLLSLLINGRNNPTFAC